MYIVIDTMEFNTYCYLTRLVGSSQYQLMFSDVTNIVTNIVIIVLIILIIT